MTPLMTPTSRMTTTAARHGRARTPMTYLITESCVDLAALPPKG